MIAGFLVSRASLKIPATQTQLESFVLGLTGESVSKKWIRGFKKRHAKVLRLGKPRVETKSRHADGLLADAETFIQGFSEWIEHHHVAEEPLLNCDEKRGVFSSDSGLRFKSKAEFNSNLEQPRAQSLFTMLPFVTASGRVVAIFYF